MKSTKASALREKSTEELAQLANEKSESLFNLRMSRASGSIASTADIPATRREIARIKTVMAQAKAAKA